MRGPAIQDHAPGLPVDGGGRPANHFQRLGELSRRLPREGAAKISVKEKDMVKDLFSSPIVEEIKMADPDKLTPLDALQLICEWKKRINE